MMESIIVYPPKINPNREYANTVRGFTFCPDKICDAIVPDVATMELKI